MSQSAKIFTNGRSQAVRLPAAYRFDCKEVFIRKDPKTGDVILSRKPDNWDDYLQLVKTVKIPKDFMTDREDSLAQERVLFNDK
ncbi:MAG: AbrB/MazE/SpoVT family DNA-binding domain-containing protein [Tatlockia sp.]|nr:AbrB/MazE/SpoVT family DNA-binding domain-containing protein [Tatlockia sp.]